MGKYIRQLPDAVQIQDSHFLVTDDGTHNYKATWGQLKALLATVAGFVSDPDTVNYPGYIKLTLTNGTVLRVKPSDPDKQDKLTFDQAPTEDSNNVLTSGVIYDALDEKLDAADWIAFRGATAQAAGEDGVVPAPAAGALRYLGSDGAWHAVDSAPTEDSENLVKSGGVWQAIQDAGGGGGGTSDYSQLSNKPQINGHTLASGNQSGGSLGLVNAETGKGLSANDYANADKAIVDALAALLTSANNGKVVGIVNGAFAAVEGGGSYDTWTGGSF